MPPNQFHMRNLLSPINEARLANTLKNNTTNTRANRNTGRMKRMNANRTLVKRSGILKGSNATRRASARPVRAFRFSNNQTNGKLAPTNVFGTTKTNVNRNVQLSKNLTQSRK